MKKVNEIFSDYKSGGSICAATVENAALMKKTQTLELTIRSDKYIALNEIEGLNTFLKRRFMLHDAVISINYTEEVSKKPIEETIDDIIIMLCDKYPFLKASLNNCDYEIEENAINFKFKIVVSDILRGMNYDKKIEDAIRNFYGKTYKINFIDNISAEELMKIKMEEERKILSEARKQINIAPKADTSIKKEVAATKAAPDSDSKDNGKGAKKKDANVIYGRFGHIKEKVIKITDITPDEGVVALEGEISNLESKELRSGKMLVSFDLYDGSSSMTCKSFVKPDQYDEVYTRLKGAKGVKLSGNASHSNFSGEVEMIANTILETE